MPGLVIYKLELGNQNISNLGKFGIGSRKLEMNYLRVSNIRIFVILLKVMLEDYCLEFFIITLRNKNEY